MIETSGKAKNKNITTNRIIGKYIGKINGPTIVFFAGIHGNEKAGVIALQKVFKNIFEHKKKGNIYGIVGNIKALNENKRFIDNDLNRLWTKSQLESLKTKTNLNSEEQEQKELYVLIENILNTHQSQPIYFIDLHTTSSKTLPFITINDALINRKFSKLFPVPIVLGIEEYLNGPLLSYINQLGYVSLGFESGQHNDKEAITNCIAFINLALVYTKIISVKKIIGYPIYFNQLRTNSEDLTKIFEVVFLHRISENETFNMLPGFKSFQIINKGLPLANNNSHTIKSVYKGRLFMPLYQKQGKEGFFIIRKIAPIFLKLSEILRRLKIDSLLILLPGVSWETKEKQVLKVNIKIARFFAKSLFHLLGYRSQTIDKTHIKFYNRERTAKSKMYKKEAWY